VPELTRRDRLAATERFDDLADEIAQMSRWLDRIGGDADKASVLLECAARDLRAAAWVIRPADHSRPPGYLDGSRAERS
jgi:hypothetical protein